MRLGPQDEIVIVHKFPLPAPHELVGKIVTATMLQIIQYAFRYACA